MKLSDYVVDFLAGRGLKHIFLLPGGGCMHLADSVGRRRDLKYVCCLHEQACAYAAEAYGEYAGQFGCALVTSGPGGTNAISGVAAAWIESSPCIFLSGQAKRSDLIGSRAVRVRSLGPQEIDITAVVRPITKYAVQVLDPAQIRSELERAVWIANEGRKGPVWLDIPLDVQAAQIEPGALRSFEPPPEAGCDLSPVCARILSSLAAARRPAIYAGNGIRTAGALDSFRSLAKMVAAPVLLSWKASDYFPEGDALYIGRPGGIGQRAANFTQQKADWLLVLGSRLDQPSVAFNYPGFAPKAHKIFVDVDPAELSKFNPPPDEAVCSDLSALLPALLAEAKGRALPDFSGWLDQCRSWVRRYPVVLPEYWGRESGTVSTYVLMKVLSDLARPDDILLPGSSGPCSDIFYQVFEVKSGQRILNAPGLGAMGTGLPATIGACLASGGRRVINVNGEGGFQLNIQELETVRRLDLPIKFVVLDNNGYASILAMQRNHFQGRIVGADPSSGLTLPRLEEVGRAYGLPVRGASSLPELQKALRETLEEPGPAICIVKTSADEVTAPRATSEIRPDGTIVSRPMEDMAPLLDRDEFNSVMES